MMTDDLVWPQPAQPARSTSHDHQQPAWLERLKRWRDRRRVRRVIKRFARGA